MKTSTSRTGMPRHPGRPPLAQTSDVAPGRDRGRRLGALALAAAFAFGGWNHAQAAPASPGGPGPVDKDVFNGIDSDTSLVGDTGGPPSPGDVYDVDADVAVDLDGTVSVDVDGGPGGPDGGGGCVDLSDPACQTEHCAQLAANVGPAAAACCTACLASVANPLFAATGSDFAACAAGCGGGGCSGVNCSDPASCTPECCGSCLPISHCMYNGCPGSTGPCEEMVCDFASGACVAIYAPYPCDDGNPCTVDGPCDPAAGCVYEPVDCSNPATCSLACCTTCGPSCENVTCPTSTNPCVEWACDPTIGGCYEIITANPCDDGDPCTVGEYCSGGACVGMFMPPCDDANPCTVDGCHPTTGCVHTAVVCDDQNPCTDDSCHASGSTCVYVPNAVACDDGVPCTEGDVCTGGACVGVPKTCDDGVQCTIDWCQSDTGDCGHDPSLGGCPSAAGPCEEPVCDPVLGCTTQPKANGEPCDDGNPCTLEDSCQDGVCVGGPEKDCSDDSSCTDELCNPATGKCEYPLAPDACSECAPGLPPLEASVSFETEFDIKGKCPVLGGSAGVKVTASGQVSGAVKGCPDCEASLSAGGQISGALTVCKGNTFSLSGGGAYTGKIKTCVECDMDTCEKKCGGKACNESEYSGFAGIGISRFFGYANRFSAGGGRILPTISMTINCGVTVAGTAKGEASYTETEDKGCDPCVGCEQVTGGGSFSVNGKGGCGAKLQVSKFSAKIGCMECGELEVGLGASGTKKSGECGAGGCFSGSVNAKAGIHLPCWDVGLWWFKVAVACDASVAGSCSVSSCEDPGCGIDGVSANCTVSKGSCK